MGRGFDPVALAARVTRNSVEIRRFENPAAADHPVDVQCQPGNFQATIVFPEWVPPKRSGTMAPRKTLDFIHRSTPGSRRTYPRTLSWMDVSRGAHLLTGMILFNADVEASRVCWELLGGCDARSGAERHDELRGIRGGEVSGHPIVSRPAWTVEDNKRQMQVSDDAFIDRDLVAFQPRRRR